MKGIPHSPGEAARLRFVMLTYMNLAMLHLIQARDAAQRVGRDRDAGFFDTGAAIVRVQSDEARRVTAPDTWPNEFVLVPRAALTQVLGEHLDHDDDSCLSCGEPMVGPHQPDCPAAHLLAALVPEDAQGPS